MSSRTRTLEILTQSRLAGSDLERERLRAQREAQQQQSVLSALQILGGTALDAGGRVYGVLDQNAQEEARAAALRGDLDNGVPEQQEKDPLSSFVNDPLGLKKKAVGTAAAERKDFLSERARADAKEAEKVKREQDEAQRKRDEDAALRAQEIELAEAQRQEQREYEAARKAEAMEYEQSVREQEQAAKLEQIAAQNQGRAASRKSAGGGSTDKELADAKRQKILDDARKAKALADAAERDGARDAEGRQIPATVAQEFGARRYTVKAARDFATEVKPEEFTPHARAAALLPKKLQPDNVQKLTRKIDRFIQDAGKGLEGGKLAEGDAKRYQEMLISSLDSYEGFTSSLQTIAQEIEDKMIEEKAELAEQGFKVGRGSKAAPPSNAPPAPSGSTVAPRGRDTSFDDFMGGP